MKVLIVAGSSRLGPYAIASLEKEHELRVTDIVPVETSHEFMEMDISSLDDVMRASEGVDAIVNCSVVRPDRQLAFDVNTRGCYNMMRAAVDHGIERVINTGPHFTIAAGTYESLDYDIHPDVPPHPGTGLYALSKGLGQETCRVFTEHHDLHVLCLLFYNFREH
ncbi:MAG: NAD-dependent epimerase/dehydratase family protein, partial [bacterium]|nr:NAD-dependent epimerase/dehydratase family protein [bacterium]